MIYRGSVVLQAVAHLGLLKQTILALHDQQAALASRVNRLQRQCRLLTTFLALERGEEEP